MLSSLVGVPAPPSVDDLPPPSLFLQGGVKSGDLPAADPSAADQSSAPTLAPSHSVQLEDERRMQRVGSLKKEAVQLKRMSSVGRAVAKLREAKELERQPRLPTDLEGLVASVDDTVAQLERQVSWKAIEAVDSVQLTPADLGDEDLLLELAELQMEMDVVADESLPEEIDGLMCNLLPPKPTLLQLQRASSKAIAGLQVPEESQAGCGEGDAATADDDGDDNDEDDDEGGSGEHGAKAPEAGGDELEAEPPVFEEGTTAEICKMLGGAFPGFGLPPLNASVELKAAGSRRVNVRLAFSPDLVALGMAPEVAASDDAMLEQMMSGGVGAVEGPAGGHGSEPASSAADPMAALMATLAASLDAAALEVSGSTATVDLTDAGLDDELDALAAAAAAASAPVPVPPPPPAAAPPAAIPERRATSHAEPRGSTTSELGQSWMVVPPFPPERQAKFPWVGEGPFAALASAVPVSAAPVLASHMAQQVGEQDGGFVVGAATCTPSAPRVSVVLTPLSYDRLDLTISLVDRSAAKAQSEAVRVAPSTSAATELELAGMEVGRPCEDLYGMLSTLRDQLYQTDYLATHPPDPSLLPPADADDAGAGCAETEAALSSADLGLDLGLEHGVAPSGELASLLGTLRAQLRQSDLVVKGGSGSGGLRAGPSTADDEGVPDDWEDADVTLAPSALPGSASGKRVYSSSELLRFRLVCKEPCPPSLAGRYDNATAADGARNSTAPVPKPKGRTEATPAWFREAPAAEPPLGTPTSGLPPPTGPSAAAMAATARAAAGRTAAAIGSAAPAASLAPAAPPAPARPPPQQSAFVWNPAYLTSRAAEVVDAADRAPPPPPPPPPTGSGAQLSGLLATLSRQLEGTALPPMPQSAPVANAAGVFGAATTRPAPPMAAQPVVAPQPTRRPGAPPAQSRQPPPPRPSAQPLGLARQPPPPPQPAPQPAPPPPQPSSASAHLLGMLGIQTAQPAPPTATSAHLLGMLGIQTVQPAPPATAVRPASMPPRPTAVPTLGASTGAFPTPPGAQNDASRHLLSMLGVGSAAAAAPSMPPMSSSWPPQMASPPPTTPMPTIPSRPMPPAGPPPPSPGAASFASSPGMFASPAGPPNAASKHLLGLLGVGGLSPAQQPPMPPMPTTSSTTTYAPPAPHTPMHRSPFPPQGQGQPPPARTPALAAARTPAPSRVLTEDEEPSWAAAPVDGGWAHPVGSAGGEDFLAQLAQQTMAWHGKRPAR